MLTSEDAKQTTECALEANTCLKLIQLSLASRFGLDLASNHIHVLKAAAKAIATILGQLGRTTYTTIGCCLRRHCFSPSLLKLFDEKEKKLA